MHHRLGIEGTLITVKIAAKSKCLWWNGTGLNVNVAGKEFENMNPHMLTSAVKIDVV